MASVAYYQRFIKSEVIKACCLVLHTKGLVSKREVRHRQGLATINDKGSTGNEVGCTTCQKDSDVTYIPRLADSL